ncbi:uncharacterized protein (DUF2384 family) [Salirhabdus euzebyi]|uniref:Uncharacterized protein (DUF2384 family) n=1 Tax=Salirhabdus euzebyi TaxID=394506 RepID=A0A841Q7D7_9BACI|nr:YqzE family protein [Salirhabdus euzebyi]MBB6454253.1 uncharacterized protein (DUF2384 family) [Salirhabdus euzebyi]
MAGNDFVKYMTQELVKYAHLPKDEKIKRRHERKMKREELDRTTKYFGMLPAAIKMWRSGKRKH